MAAPCQVRCKVVATMFDCNYVFDVKGIRLIVFVNAAILAAPACTIADVSSNRGIHPEFLASMRRALACRIAMRLPTVTKRSYSARSRGVNSPSLHLRASSSTRACVLASAFRRTSLRAASTFRLLVTGAKRRSRTAVPLRRLMRRIVLNRSSIRNRINHRRKHQRLWTGKALLTNDQGLRSGARLRLLISPIAHLGCAAFDLPICDRICSRHPNPSRDRS